MSLRRVLLPAAFELSWLLPWLWQLGAGAEWWMVVAALGLAAGLPRRYAHWLVWAGLVLAAIFGSIVIGGPAAGFLAALALWRGRAARDADAEWLSRLVAAAIVLSALVIWQAHWDWTLPLTLVLGVAAMSESSRPQGIRNWHWWSLGATLGLLGLGAAAVAVGLAWWAPWARVTPYLLQAFKLLMTGVVWLLAKLLPKGLKPRQHQPPSPVSRFHHEANRLTHVNPAAGHVITWVLIGLGVAALLMGAWLVSRVWAAWTPPEGEDEAELVRETHPPRRPRREALTWTRLFVARRMGWARRRGYGPGAHETVREWLFRVYGEVPAGAVETYEQIRYGGRPDGPEVLRRTEAGWPQEEPHASQTAQVVNPSLPR
jgi:hypothetical protein